MYITFKVTPESRQSIPKNSDLFYGHALKVYSSSFSGYLRQQLVTLQFRDQDLTKANSPGIRGCIWQLQLPHPHRHPYSLPISASSCAYANQISTSTRRNNRQMQHMRLGKLRSVRETESLVLLAKCLPFFGGFRLSQFSHCSFFPPVKWKSGKLPRLDNQIQSGHLASHRERARVLAGFRPTACVFVSGSEEGYGSAISLPDLTRSSSYWGFLILSCAFVPPSSFFCARFVRNHCHKLYNLLSTAAGIEADSIDLMEALRNSDDDVVSR